MQRIRMKRQTCCKSKWFFTLAIFDDIIPFTAALVGPHKEGGEILATARAATILIAMEATRVADGTRRAGRGAGGMDTGRGRWAIKEMNEKTSG